MGLDVLDHYECEGQLTIFDVKPNMSECIERQCFHEYKGKCYCRQCEHFEQVVPPEVCSYIDSCLPGGIDIGV